MKYRIKHLHQPVGKPSQHKRLAMVDTIEAAVIMGHAMALDLGRNSTRASGAAVPHSIHICAMNGGERAFDVACFLGYRDSQEDVGVIIARAHERLKKWRADQRVEKIRLAWWRSNSGGASLGDCFRDEDFKAAFIANDLTRAGERLKELTQEMRAAA